jgi:murein DD-endopeptidase MepM/ murein hydrolase activator NlpD
VVTSIRATPTNLPSFSPLKRDEVDATSTASADVAGEEEAEETAIAEDIEAAATISDAEQTADDTDATSAATADGSEANGTAEATPLPTFTPPPQSGASPNEHYWLQRPVAAGGTNWTDKYYPYGSTRGGQLRTHHGVEFNVTYNTTILAAGNGTVVVAGPDDEVAYGPHTNFYGNLVVIEHDFQFAGQPLYTLYGHLNEVQVTAGEAVSAGQAIGLSGATGVADGPHLHFEVRVGANDYGSTRNPLLWLAPYFDRGTVAGRVAWPNGEPATETPVSLNRIDGPSPYYGATTYAGSSVNADEGWQENFVIDDVVAGFYQITVRNGEEKYTVETWVRPQQTSFVEITLD